EPAAKTEKSSRQRKSPLLPKTGRSGAPVLTDALKTRLFDLRKAGFNRLYQNGQVFEFSSPESLLDINFSEPVFVLVDRLTVSADARSRVVDAIETAYREAGEVIFEIPRVEESAATDMSVRPTPATLRFAQRFECKFCNIRYEEPEPRLFSFNNP